MDAFLSLFLAHAEHGGGSGLTSGFLHPLGGIDHILAMVAVGLWGAQLGRPAIWVLPVAFPLVMALGGALGLMGFPLPGVEVGIAGSALVLGLLVAWAARPPLWLAATAIAIFAIFHGYAHGAELPAGANGLLYSLGFVIATGLLHGAGILIGALHRLPWGGYVLRFGGVIIAFGGAFYLWQAMA